MCPCRYMRISRQNFEFHDPLNPVKSRPRFQSNFQPSELRSLRIINILAQAMRHCLRINYAKSFR